MGVNFQRCSYPVMLSYAFKHSVLVERTWCRPEAVLFVLQLSRTETWKCIWNFLPCASRLSRRSSLQTCPPPRDVSVPHCKLRGNNLHSSCCLCWILIISLECSILPCFRVRDFSICAFVYIILLEFESHPPLKLFSDSNLAYIFRH